MRVSDAMFTAALVLLVLLSPVHGSAQGVESLWDEYATLSSTFDEQLAECLELGAGSVSGDRLCRSVVETGRELTAALEQILAIDESLSADDRAFGVDELLTTHQIVAAMLVSLSECGSAGTVLDELEADPRVEARPRLAEAIAETRAAHGACEDGPATSAERDADRDAEGRAPDLAAQGAPAQPSERRSVGPWVLMSAGAVAVGAGFAHVPSSRSVTNEIECFNDAACDSMWDIDRATDEQDRRDAINRRATWLWASGGVAIASGLAWKILDARGAEPPVAAGLGGRSVWLRASF